MDLNEQGCKSDGKLKSIPGASECSPSTGQTPYDLEEYKMLIGELSSPSILFAADSPANHSVSPGSAEARQMTVTSGLKLSAVLALSGPLGSLVKTCLESSMWHSTRCMLTWKVSVTPSKRSIYQLAPSMPRTSENGSGLWPTPTARDHKDAGRNMDWAKAKAKCKLAGAIGGQVNPAFSEWLMGYPQGWTDLED